jgi:hypothetical protein
MSNPDMNDLVEWEEEIHFHDRDGVEQSRYETLEGYIISFVSVGSEVHAVIRRLRGGFLCHKNISSLKRCTF